MKKKTPRKTGKSRKPNPGRESALPLEQVRELIDLLEERGLEEFEFEREGVRIRIKRRGAVGVPPPVFESYAAPEPAASTAPKGETPSEEAQVQAAAEMGVAAEDVHIIKSPLVGTLYAAPQPDAPLFVHLGDTVEVGQVLCIVEAMKLMNEIEADIAGEIARIFVENAQPVEYGEPLFAIRPGKK